MVYHFRVHLQFLFLMLLSASYAQVTDSILTIDRIYNSAEFSSQRQRPVSWIENGNAFVSIEKDEQGRDQLIRYESKNNQRSLFLIASALESEELENPLEIEDFSLSPDASKVLIFTNSSRVWRSNTKGDYWIYDFDTGQLRQIGKKFPSSSLMFAKFSNDNSYVAYVHDFNIYKENYQTGKITALTDDGNGDIINGTFDWVYEEEFGDRDGFSISPNGKNIAFWQLDASEIGTFYMIDNTDSVYSEPIPLQYPKVGYDPSSAKIGLINASTGEKKWISIPGDQVQHYLPAMQWVNRDMLLIQQLNRKQNELDIYTYDLSENKLNKIYTESAKTWVDLKYPDISSSQWGNNDLLLTKDQKYFLRMTESGKWRQAYKISISTGEKHLITPGDFDVAEIYTVDEKYLYFEASPDNPTQRYLYRTPLNGNGKKERLTPSDFQGTNTYNIAPNSKFAIQRFTNTSTPLTVELISLPSHYTIQKLVGNTALKNKLKSLKMPETEFFKVTTEDGVEIDGRMTKPVDFDPSKTYPVLFHVYGEPWSAVATDTFIGMYDVFLAQHGFVIINMDNRGTPVLNGSAWRKAIYRKVGVLNSRDQALAAKETLQKFNFLDKDRVSVWGWSGGGSMTLNLMFRYPEIYKTGMAVAAVSNQLFYDNVYQERYMGLPQENMEDFVEGSPVTYAKNLEGNLLVVHGTGDDNVHYQNMEYLVNELIRKNKQFTMMAYPNRSHGIYEGKNTRRHLFTLLTNYLFSHNGMSDEISN